MYIDFVAVRQLVPLRTVLGRCGVELHREGRATLRGGCPIHGSSSQRSRSLAVTGDEWYCHHCRIGGDVTDLWRALTGLPLIQAAADLCQTFGVPLPRRTV